LKYLYSDTSPQNYKNSQPSLISLSNISFSVQ
jgi:hypothetical protein